MIVERSAVTQAEDGQDGLVDGDEVAEDEALVHGPEVLTTFKSFHARLGFRPERTSAHSTSSRRC